MARPLVWLYDIDEVRTVPIHDLGELVVEDRLGDLETLVFTMRADDPKVGYVSGDLLAMYDGRYYRVEELRKYRDGPKPLIEVYCEARWLDLGKRIFAGTFNALGVTPLAGLTSILAGTGWTAAVDPSDADLYSMEDIDSSSLALARRWAGIVGREIAFDTVAKTVTLVPAIGVDRGIGFRYGHNLRSVNRRERPPVATVLYPFGAGNLSIVNVNPLLTQYVEDYSYYTARGLTIAEARARYTKSQVWNDTRYVTAIDLYDAAIRRLAALAQPTVSYELAVADFAQLTGSTADDVELGDTVRVRDPGFDFDVATRVVRLVRRPLRPQDNEIELDYLQPGIADVENPETSRVIDYGDITILADANVAVKTVTGVNNDLAAIQITTAGETVIVAGGTIKGTATGTGTVRWSLTVSGVDEVPTYDFAFVAGQTEFSWPTYIGALDASTTKTITWRGRVISGAGTISIAIGEARGWILAKGAVGIGINNSPNTNVEETVVLEVAAAMDSVDELTLITVTDIDEEETPAVELVTVTDNDAGAPPTVTLI